MARLAKRLESDRAVRNSVRGRFDERLQQVRDDLDARGVGGRIADRISQDARDIFEEGLDVVDQNRGVVAGTIAALAIWFLRNPILASIEKLLRYSGEDKESGHD